MEKRRNEESFRKRDEPLRRRTAFGFHVLTLCALLYIIILLRSRSAGVNTLESEQVSLHALADVDSDVVSLTETLGVSGKSVGGASSDSQIVDLTEGGEARATSEHSVGADVASSGSTLESTSPVSTGAGDMEKSSNCAALEAADRVFQNHLRKRREFYGNDPIASVEALHSKHHKPSSIYSAFLLELFTPNYQCFPEERVGVWSDGGKWICRVDSLNRSSIVYSVGCNGKDDFELEMFKRIGCEIHVFDHTLRPNVKSRVLKKSEYKFHDVGLGNVTEPKKKIMTLKDVMEMLGHTYIDVLKIDCEGCEYEVLPSVLNQMRKPFGQIQVEVHQIARRARMAGLFLAMEKAGYRLFHQEMNWRAMNHFELAFIHEDLCTC